MRPKAGTISRSSISLQNSFQTAGFESIDIIKLCFSKPAVQLTQQRIYFLRRVRYEYV